MKTTLGYNTLDLIKHAKGNSGCKPKCALSEKLQPGHLLEMLLVVLQHLRATKKQDLIKAFLGVAFRNYPQGSQERLSAFPEDKFVEVWTLAAKHIFEKRAILEMHFDECLGVISEWNPRETG